MNDEKGLELNIVEPSLAVIISNLDVVLMGLNKFSLNKSNISELNDLVEEFNNLESLDQWENLIKSLINLSNLVKNEIIGWDIQEEFEYLIALNIAVSMAKHFSDNGFIFEHLTENYRTENDAIDDMRCQITILVNKKYEQIRSLIQNIKNEQLNKLVNIMINETEWNDLHYGNELIDQTIVVADDMSIKEKIELLNIVNDLDALIDWIDIWSQQDNLED